MAAGYLLRMLDVLNAERKALEEQIAEIDRERERVGTRIAGVTASSLRGPGRRKRMRPSGRDRIVATLNEKPEHVWDARSVHTAAPDIPLSYVRVALVKLAEDGKIDKVSLGRYRGRPA